MILCTIMLSESRISYTFSIAKSTGIPIYVIYFCFGTVSAIINGLAASRSCSEFTSKQIMNCFYEISTFLGSALVVVLELFWKDPSDFSFYTDVGYSSSISGLSAFTNGFLLLYYSWISNSSTTCIS